MEISIRAFRRAVADTFDRLTYAGPIHVVNASKRGSPTEAVLVPPELWEQITKLPTARRKIAEHAAQHEDAVTSAAWSEQERAA